MEIAAAIEQRFAAVEARGWMHAREVGAVHGTEVRVGADTPVVTASVIKIVICAAFARAVASGALDPREPIEVPANLRVGGSGTTACLDPVRMSLRDLARSMMTVSDNAATDLVLERTGGAEIAALLDALGLTATHVRGGMHWGHMRVVEALGFESPHDLDGQLKRADPDAVRALGWLDPEHANSSTPREITTLLDALWSDRAGPPQACAFVRELMGEALTTHGLAAAFPDDGYRVAAKTGTLPTIRNEAGVITHPDGRRYAVAVFTRTASLSSARPDVDAAIGEAARLAVASLRERSGRPRPAGPG